MIKVGDKVYHWQTINRIGTVIKINTVTNNQMTVGGTTDSRVFYVVQYDNGEKIIHLSGEVMKHFD